MRHIVINLEFVCSYILVTGLHRKLGYFQFSSINLKGRWIGTCSFLTACERTATIPLLPWRNRLCETEAPPTETETAISSRSRVRLTDTEVPHWREPLWISAVLSSKQTHTPVEHGIPSDQDAGSVRRQRWVCHRFYFLSVSSYSSYFQTPWRYFKRQ